VLIILSSWGFPTGPLRYHPPLDHGSIAVARWLSSPPCA
jgi:hypothetical protein